MVGEAGFVTLRLLILWSSKRFLRILSLFFFLLLTSEMKLLRLICMAQLIQVCISIKIRRLVAFGSKYLFPLLSLLDLFFLIFIKINDWVKTILATIALATFQCTWTANEQYDWQVFELPLRHSLVGFWTPVIIL